MSRLVHLLFLLMAIASIGVVAHLPAPVSAGGWQCFVCHGGFDVTGTDLAPPLAGSSLSDEQIIAQVRNPRGIMPSFSKEELPDQLLKDGFIQPFVRSLPAGRPTATLDAQTRAVALATLAAVASERSGMSSQRTAPAGNSTQAPLRPSGDSGLGDATLAMGALVLLGGFLLGLVTHRVWGRGR